MVRPRPGTVKAAGAFFPVVAGFLFYWLVVAIFRVTEYEEFRGWTNDDKPAGEK
jgi:hypothetical protein